jgi:hypothetical protein
MKQENREEMKRANKNGQRVFGALLVIFVVVAIIELFVL